MFRRIVLSAALAGLVAGLALTLLQLAWAVPLVHRAEILEASAPPAVHEHADSEAQLHTHAHDAWAPADGIERTAWTAVTNILAGVGFALLLGAGFGLRGQAGLRQGVLWGAAGFAAFHLAPAFGLPPELPGTQAAELSARQGWWLLTVLATAGGLGLLAFGRRWAVRVLGAGLIGLPHLIGAPRPDSPGSLAPPALEAEFVVAALITSAVFWLLLGGLTGAVYRRFGNSA